MAKTTKCPICNSSEVQVKYPAEFNYENMGLSNVVLTGSGVVTTKCQSCSHSTTGVTDEQQLLQVLALAILFKPPGISGEELRFLRSILGVTQMQLAKSLALARRETISEWESRDRVFATSFVEITPRLVLLDLFKTQVFESDLCFLTTDHRNQYDDFTRSFVDRIQQTLHEEQKSQRLKINCRNRNHWSTDLVGSCE